MIRFSIAEENYLKTIYHLQNASGIVATNDLAAALHTAPASVTDMLKKLSKKGLVSYKAYYGCTLTEAGEEGAVSIVRRHRLWEYFLSQKLGFSWEEVHEVAEELEHISNEKLIDKLDAFLGFPRTDPHGDPIPDAKGKIIQTKQVSLATLSEKQVAIVTQIGNQSPEVLEMLDEKNISIGSRIQVIKKYAFDESMEVRTDNKHQSYLTKELSQNIFIKN
ncbi:MAG TPA: metal-dependent transcriptional regulator [Niabella sp.]|nr:metal-dependent transcriptional regulator [Niabella sp.]